MITGDNGGIIRGFSQGREPVDNKGRPCGGQPARAHGTVNITRPKDPTRPLLTQVQIFCHYFCFYCRRTVTLYGDLLSNKKGYIKFGRKELFTRISV